MPALSGFRFLHSPALVGVPAAKTTGYFALRRRVSGSRPSRSAGASRLTNFYRSADSAGRAAVVETGAGAGERCGKRGDCNRG